MSGLDEITREFLVESLELLEQLDHLILSLEAHPADMETLASIFRAVHTIKGNSALLGLSRLELVNHHGENLLGKLRQEHRAASAEVISALLALIDAVRQILGSLEASGKEGNADFTALCDRFDRLGGGDGLLTAFDTSQSLDSSTGGGLSRREIRTNVTPGGALSGMPEAVEAGAVLAAHASRQLEGATGSSPAARRDSEADSVDTQKRESSAYYPVPPAQMEASRPDPRLGLDFPDVGSQAYSSASGLPLMSDLNVLTELGVLRGASEMADDGDGQVRVNMPTTPSVSDNSLRVEVSQLDRLMNLVGELVLTRNQILRFSQGRDDTAYLATTQRLNLITTELQEGVMKTRMQPVGTVWDRFPRMLRDLAVACGKQVDIEMDGRNTELDKTIIEAIKVPLAQLVQNAIMHGLEAPEVREKGGKPRSGRLSLRAYHEGGHVTIEITDDGAGFDSEMLKQRALTNKLVPNDQLARMSERDILNLVFTPGVLTASTNKFGDDEVGLHTVKASVEKIGGTVDLYTHLYVGTTIRLKIPLTLAIIPALIVSAGGEHFAIPQVNLLELVRLEGDRAHLGIETVLGTPVYRLRGQLLPLTRLKQELRLTENVDESGDDAVNIVVLQADNRQFGLVVDEINDTEEIVVKPLGKQLKAIPTFAGATIMGDDRVALILDVTGIVKQSSIVSGSPDRLMANLRANNSQPVNEKKPLLLFDVGAQGRMVVPLEMVSRLEEFSTQALESSQGREVVQYRQSILPLVRLSEFLPDRRSTARDAYEVAEDQALQVVVYTEKGRNLGIVVGNILDVVEEPLNQLRPPARPGILGTLVIQNRVTQVLDVRSVVQQVYPEFLKSSATRM